MNGASPTALAAGTNSSPADVPVAKNTLPLKPDDFSKVKEEHRDILTKALDPKATAEQRQALLDIQKTQNLTFMNIDPADPNRKMVAVSDERLKNYNVTFKEKGANAYVLNHDRKWTGVLITPKSTETTTAQKPTVKATDPQPKQTADAEMTLPPVRQITSAPSLQQRLEPAA